MAALALPSLALAPLSGCALVAQGDHDLETLFVLKKFPEGRISGYTELTIDQAPGPDDQAILKRVVLYAPDGTKDLTFIQSLLGQSTPVTGASAQLVRGGGFPKDDTIGQLKVLYKENLRPFFKDRSIKVDWSGQVDPTFPFPPKGFYQIRAVLTVEVL